MRSTSRRLRMLFPTPPRSSSTLNQEPSETFNPVPPFHLHDCEEGFVTVPTKRQADLLARQERAAVLLRERLSGIPFYDRAAKLAEEQTGDPLAYWMASVTPAACMLQEN